MTPVNAKGNSTEWAAGYLYTNYGFGSYRFDATAWPIGGGPARILTPPGSIGSDAFAVSGSLVGGWTENGGIRHAYVWDIASEQEYDLHPPAAVSGSNVGGLDGNRAVGMLGFGGGVTHAVLWDDVAEGSYVDMDPSSEPFRGSEAYALCGGSQVGRLNRGAALWCGSAESYVRLHPDWIPTALSSIAYGVSQNVQVGLVVFDIPNANTPTHASVWFGSAESFFDLHSLLDPAIIATAWRTTSGWTNWATSTWLAMGGRERWPR